jgi:outer membrane lipoprotein carrier protein
LVIKLGAKRTGIAALLLIIIILGLSAGVEPQPLMASSTTESLSTEELRELQSKLKERQTLTVRFTQTRVSSLRPKKPSTSIGKAVFAKPAKFRWEFEKPAADILLFDGRSLISYKPGDTTATKFSPNAEKAREIKEVIDFVLDFDALLGRYSIKEATRSKNLINLSLNPKSSSAITSLSIEIDAKSHFVTVIKMSFQNRNTTEFRFSEPSTAAISPDAFRLPKGVTVVEGV